MMPRVNIGKNDRAIAIGTAIPSVPVVATLETVPRFLSELKTARQRVGNRAPDMYRYYWH